MENISINLNIPENRFNFFMELIKEFDFVKITKKK